MEPNVPDHFSKRCVKCLAAMPNPDWIVNKDMAYCNECAALLHLGESKESRIFNDMQDKVSDQSPDPVPMPVPEDLDIEGLGTTDPPLT
ncbi:MAG TPA: hypothetical protein VJ385_21540 [Fibrobacteria bacterium]|nr:hypothetical protein [Fibrobacteria bacterium]